MTRIDIIASYIDNNDKVIDVGCDQALLGKKLAERKIRSIASDIKESIIENAKKSTKENLKEYIEFRVGDGVTLKSDEKEYILVLSGMGTYTILNIIKNNKVPLKRIITISNNNHDILRKEMNNLGYKITLEEIIKEKGKYYNLIIFSKGKQLLTKEELIIGYNHQNKNLLKEKNNYILNKYKKILNKSNNKELIEIVNIIENYNY